MAAYNFFAFYTASKQGKTGLTVTVDVYGPAGAEVTGAAATEVGGGLYKYTHTDATDGDYTAVFKTADATVDMQHVPALAATPVWETSTRTITSFGTLIADIWAYTTRTITMAVATVLSAISSLGDITALRGDTFTVSLTGLGNISTRSSLALVVKASKNDSDTAAVLYVSEADGLTLVNGAAYTTPAHGVITVTDATAGNITLTIHATAMALLSPGVRVYDVQYVLADGTVRSTPASPFTVSADVNRAVS
jgi:hypothetical protein